MNRKPNGSKPVMDRDEAIRRGHAEGRTLQEVGDELGITREWVRRLSKQLGLTFRTPTVRTLARIEKARALVADGASVNRASKLLHVSRDTLTRAGLRSLPVAPAHNRAGYNRGCRCEICMAANREYARNLRRGKEPPKHGTISAYVNYACRCAACKAAKAEANAKYRAKCANRPQ